MIIKRFLIFVISCSLVVPDVFSQGINNLFLLGYNGGGGPLKINFGSGSPVITPDTRTINANRTNANIADINGNLLFYTNGIAIGNALNDTMLNGGGLNPCAYTTSWTPYGLRITQAALIIPAPGDSIKYYLFHDTRELSTNPFRPINLYTSIIDMSLDNGLGGVILKNNSILQDTLVGGQLTACKHANGRDWWIVAPEFGHPAYYLLLLTPSGVTVQSKQTIGNRFYEGQAAFSPDGTHYGSYSSDDDMELFDFDRCSGIFSNYRHATIFDNNFGIGFSFSPDSKLAYASSAHFLYQVNLDSANLSASLDTVAVWDSTYSPFPPIETGFDLQQLAPDGKIYIATTFASDYMHIINSPNVLGDSCQVLQHSLYLNGLLNDNTIPNHPNYFLGPLIGSVCDSLGLGVQEYASINFNLSAYPNPTTTDLTINYRLPQNSKGIIELLTVLGERVYTLNLPQWSTMQKIQLPPLAKGVYGLRIKSGVSSVMKKIIIQ
jgi:hypothetical protein